MTAHAEGLLVKHGDCWQTDCCNGNCRYSHARWKDLKGCLNQFRFNIGDPLAAYDRDPYLDEWFDQKYNPRWSEETFLKRLLKADSSRPPIL